MRANVEIEIECRGVSKRFGDVVAVESLDLRVEQGRLLALLGPSGCGKTTVLRLIAGFERPDAGRVLIEGREVAGPGVFVPPEKRRIGMVFQEFALFPHMTIGGNVGYGLGRGRGARERVREMLALVGLEGCERRYPHQLSGGQQQRVALARALAPRPRLVLLDEPFSNLDSALRESVRFEVREILKACSTTAILVTHDQEEALSVADTIAVMRAGRVAQAGTPDEVYQAPYSCELARFLGDGNLLSGRVENAGVRCELGVLGCNRPGQAGCACQVLVRPESIRLCAPGEGIPARVVRSVFFGHDRLVTARLESGTEVRLRLLGDEALRPGDRIWLKVTGPAVAYAAGSAATVPLSCSTCPQQQRGLGVEGVRRGG